MSQWRQANPQATLTEIEEAVEAELAQLRKQLVEAMVQEATDEAPETVACAQCGQEMVKNGRRKMMVTALHAAIQPDKDNMRIISAYVL